MILVRVGDRKQTKRHNIAEILFWQGVSEIQWAIPFNIRTPLSRIQVFNSYTH